MTMAKNVVEIATSREQQKLPSSSSSFLFLRSDWSSQNKRENMSNYRLLTVALTWCVSLLTSSLSRILRANPTFVKHTVLLLFWCLSPIQQHGISVETQTHCYGSNLYIDLCAPEKPQTLDWEENPFFLSSNTKNLQIDRASLTTIYFCWVFSNRKWV